MCVCIYIWVHKVRAYKPDKVLFGLPLRLRWRVSLNLQTRKLGAMRLKELQRPLGLWSVGLGAESVRGLLVDLRLRSWLRCWGLQVSEECFHRELILAGLCVQPLET